MRINIKRIRDDAIVPTRGSVSAAGYDMYACGIDEPIDIAPGSCAKIKTGVIMEIPEGYFGAIYARSGMATKQGLRPANCVGVVDSDYRGEIMVFLHNDSSFVRTIENGERIAQIVITPYLNVEFNEVDVLSDTARGEGGFGSTGVR